MPSQTRTGMPAASSNIYPMPTRTASPAPRPTTGNTPSFGATQSQTAQSSGGMGGIGAGISNILGTTPTYNTLSPYYYDPLEASGQGQRSALYNQISGLMPGLMSNAQGTSGAMGQAYALPGWGQARQLASSEMAGNYLHGSPELDAAMAQMRAGSQAATANTNAGIRSQYAMNGMGFGTPQMEAESASSAANNASTNNAEAQARLQNYQGERQLQSNAVNNYATATTTPLNYLAQDNQPYTQTISDLAQVVKGLSSGGQVINPDTIADKGSLGNILGAIGSI